MAVHILQFRPQIPHGCDWTQAELAEFYRVESALLQAGVRLEAERGLSDEGDPWFIFCRQDTGEVFIHFARLDGEYIIDGAPYAGVARHRDFKVLVRELIASELFTLSGSMRRPQKGGNVFMHPAALLIALVGAAFFHSGKADAAELSDHRATPRRQGGFVILSNAAAEKSPLGLDAVQTATIVSGILIGTDPQSQLPPPLSTAVSAATSAPSLALSLLPASSELSPAMSQPAVRSSVATPLADRSPGAIQVMMLAQADLHFAPAPSAPVAQLDSQLPAATVTADGGLQFVAPPPAPATVGDRPFLVATTAAVLPDDQAAAAVIQAAGASGDHKPLSLTGALPTVLAELIQQGEHVAANASPPGAPQELPGAIGSSGATPPPVSPPAAPGQVSPPSGSAQPPVTAPVSSPSAPSAPAGAGDLAHAHDAAINAAIATFVADAGTWQVIVNGRDFVVYDTHIFGVLPANTTLNSVTFTFSDGSSVSLVGTSQEISHLYLHG